MMRTGHMVPACSPEPTCMGGYNSVPFFCIGCTFAVSITAPSHPTAPTQTPRPASPAELLEEPVRAHAAHHACVPRGTHCPAAVHARQACVDIWALMKRCPVRGHPEASLGDDVRPLDHAKACSRARPSHQHVQEALFDHKLAVRLLARCFCVFDRRVVELRERERE